MVSYIIRRLLLLVPTLLLMTIVVFTAMAVAPGGFAGENMADDLGEIDPEARQAIMEANQRRFGTGLPAPVQYLRWLNAISPVGFDQAPNGDYLGFGLKGVDFGLSISDQRPVGDLIEERLPITMLLNVLALPIIYFTSIIFGVYAAKERGKAFDVSSGTIMLGLWSIPPIWAGTLMVVFLTDKSYAGWFPTPDRAGISTEMMNATFLPSFYGADAAFAFFLIPVIVTAIAVGLGYWWLKWFGGATFGMIGLTLGIIVAGEVIGANMADQFSRGYLLDFLWRLFLPVVCLTYGSFAFLAKLTRAAVLENILADFARTARAKGLSNNMVLWGHVFRNSLLPLITVAAALLPALLSGSVVVERIFEIDGMGSLVVEAVFAKDRDVVLSTTLVAGMLTLFGYLLADLGYAVVDPRVSYD